MTQKRKKRSQAKHREQRKVDIRVQQAVKQNREERTRSSKMKFIWFSVQYFNWQHILTYRKMSMITLMGVLQPTWCHASATREIARASSWQHPPMKNKATSKSPVGDISVVTLIRTDTTLDHSQKAEKVWCSHSVYSRQIIKKSPVFYYVDHPMNFINQSTTCIIEYCQCIIVLGRSPRKNCKNDLDDQTWQELE